MLDPPARATRSERARPGPPSTMCPASSTSSGRPGQAPCAPRARASPSASRSHRAPRRRHRPVFATSTTGRSSSPRASAARRIQDSNAAITASPSAKTSGWSHSAEVRTTTSGRYGSKLPAYSSASTTNATPGPRRAVAAIPIPVRAAGSSAPTNAPGSPPAPTRSVDQPAGRGALAVRPRDRDQDAARSGVGHDLLPRLQRDPGGPGRDQLRVVRVDRRERLRDRQPGRDAARR